MTKQEEIRNKIIDILDDAEIAFATDSDCRPRGCVDDILSHLKSQGVVIKKEGELPENTGLHLADDGTSDSSFDDGYETACWDIKKAGYTQYEELV